MAGRVGVSAPCSLLAILVLPVATPLVAGRSTPTLPSAASQQAYKKPIQTQRPFNVAHRGASGELPETTVAAYQKQPLLIQSFAPTALEKISKLTDSPLVFLIDDVTVTTQDNNLKFTEITSDEYFKYLKSIGVVGLGPWKDTIAVPDAQNFVQTPTDLVARAHAHGLQVHPYTFRNEASRLKFNYHLDPYQEYAFWTNVVGVDGFFADFPHSLHMYQEWTSPLNITKAQSAAELISKIADLVDNYTN